MGFWGYIVKGLGNRDLRRIQLVLGRIKSINKLWTAPTQGIFVSVFYDVFITGIFVIIFLY